jgi:catechol 2,3-dioxygenase-like lactoylglutathione lyase family enzyme
MRFHHTCILTGDRELAAKCERFYLNNFGMGVAFSSVTETSDYSFYSDNLNPKVCPFEIIGKSFDEREEDFLRRYGPGLDHISFIVEDLNTVYETMSGNGVIFHVPPYQYEDYLIAWCRDPCGVEVELLQAQIEFPEATYEGMAPKALYHHVGILCGSRNLASATEEFYRRHIGLKGAHKKNSGNSPEGIYLKDTPLSAGKRIQITEGARHEHERVFLENKGPGIAQHGFGVENVDEYAGFLLEKGVTLESEIIETGNTRMFFLRDPAGVCVQVLEL